MEVNFCLGELSMQEDLNKEILLELMKINEKLDKLNEEPQGLSKPMKVIALFIGFTVIGPLVAIVLSKLFE
jgi:F0F1-type ATP synthase assembly protein I